MKPHMEMYQGCVIYLFFFLVDFCHPPNNHPFPTCCHSTCGLPGAKRPAAQGLGHLMSLELGEGHPPRDDKEGYLPVASETIIFGF